MPSPPTTPPRASSEIVHHRPTIHQDGTADGAPRGLLARPPAADRERGEGESVARLSSGGRLTFPWHLCDKEVIVRSSALRGMKAGASQGAARARKAKNGDDRTGRFWWLVSPEAGSLEARSIPRGTRRFGGVSALYGAVERGRRLLAIEREHLEDLFAEGRAKYDTARLRAAHSSSRDTRPTDASVSQGLAGPTAPDATKRDRAA